MVKLLFLRHGNSVMNKQRRFCGQFDCELNELGVAQANQAAEYIVSNYKIDALYSSDLKRVKDTLFPTQRKLNLPVTYSKSLREVNVGSWQTRTFDEIKETDSGEFLRYKSGDTTVKLGGAESFEDLHKRALEFVKEIAKKHDGQTVLIATHGGVIRMLLEKWLNVSDVVIRKDYPITNASLTEVDFDGENAKIKFMGKSCYLSDISE